MNNRLVLKSLVIAYISFMVYPSIIFLYYCDDVIKLLLRAIGFLMMLVLYIKYIIEQKRVSRLFISCIVLSLYLLIITIIKNGSLIYMLYSNFILVIIALICCEYFFETNNQELFVKISFLYFSINNIVYLLHTIFVGNDSLILRRNHLILFYLPTIIYGYIIGKDYNNKTYNYLIAISSAIIFINFFIRGGTTTFVVLLLIYLAILIYYKKFKLRPIFYNYQLYLIILVFFFVFFDCYIESNYLVNLLCGIINKYPGFSGRDSIYLSAIKVIQNNLICGIGVIESFSHYLIWDSSHNFIFQYLIYGGVIALVLLTITIVVIFKSINCIKEKPYRFVYLIICFSFLLRCMFEDLGLNYLYYILGLLYYSNHDDYNKYIYLKKSANQ